MPGIVEIGAEAAEAALTLMPFLADVPILGRILLVLSPGGGNDLKALEEFQKVIDAKKTDRRTRRERNGRYVIKASKAMECVENNLMGASVFLAIGKAFANIILNKGGGTGPDILCDRIFTCIEENVLRQDTPRVKGTPRGKYVRPRKGHGHGRGNFK